jgi:hypothetical protein
MRGKRFAHWRTKVRAKYSILFSLLTVALFQSVGCRWISRQSLSGVWKGTIESSDKRGHKWSGPAELTLSQNGDAVTATLAFTHPQAGRIQVPISSGVLSKDDLTFSGQSQLPMGSIEITFHGKSTENIINGTADITLRVMLLGAETENASLHLNKQ